MKNPNNMPGPAASLPDPDRREPRSSEPPADFAAVKAALDEVTELKRRRLAAEHLFHSLRDSLIRKRMSWWRGLLWTGMDNGVERQEVTREQAHLFEDWLYESEMPRLDAEIRRLERSVTIRHSGRSR